MELKDLIGRHMLDAVDFTNAMIKGWLDEYEDCEVCRFRLDGTTYVAVEDPDDGYRSSMRELLVDENATMSNVFPAIEVEAAYRDKYGDHDGADILMLVDVVTGKTVLEIGTDNTDDYYPFFVSDFQPQNMATNQAA
ncbi:hypothetical protein [Brucella rhizosphaerae]|uniref:hypothetical protein n=1 Tax=Brucella rhizosphaerae TaxID=571254 RepID=UPI0004652095|nr:hypothetical protein [Brucella rhizosphaerae]